MEMLTGNGKPTRNTKGLKGQFYKDLDTGDIYECELSSEFSTLHHSPVGGYLWKLRVDGNGDDVVKDGGVVRSVNGVLPDGNGEIVFDEPHRITIHDMTSMGMGLRCNKTVDEIVSIIASNTSAWVMTVFDMGDYVNNPVYRATHFTVQTVYADGSSTILGHKYFVHFGGLYPTVIVNTVDNTITLDPDWVKPTSGGGSTNFVFKSHKLTNTETGKSVTKEELSAAVMKGPIYVANNDGSSDYLGLVMSVEPNGDGMTARFYNGNDGFMSAHTAEVVLEE